MLVTEITVLRDQVHLRKHVHVWEFEVQHYSERSHEDCNILRGIRNVVGVAKVHGSQLRETHMSYRGRNRREPYPKAAF